MSRLTSALFMFFRGILFTGRVEGDKNTKGTKFKLNYFVLKPAEYALNTHNVEPIFNIELLLLWSCRQVNVVYLAQSRDINISNTSSICPFGSVSMMAALGRGLKGSFSRKKITNMNKINMRHSLRRPNDTKWKIFHLYDLNTLRNKRSFTDQGRT